MIAWCGSSSEGLGWLSTRCSSLDKVVCDESISIADLDAICDQHPRRLILAVDNRIHYPLDEINHLQRAWPEVPWALAVGTWFDGSRRTGVGPQHHLCLPWYRWLDGWKPWISGANTDLLNPWPRTLRNAESAAEKSITTNSPQTALGTLPGIIISHCQDTGKAWKAALEGGGNASAPLSSLRVLSVQHFQSELANTTSSAPAWILWDDSSLDTFQGAEGLSQTSILFQSIRKLYPDVLLMAATSMPRWSVWQAWMSAGADELIAKPNCGVQLRDFARCLDRQGNQFEPEVRRAVTL